MNNRIPTVIYCRKSRENEESIERQEDLVRDFVERNPSLHYCYSYRDDGFTGTNFERPAWKRMMKDLERGMVKCLVVKDLARIGRNTLEVNILLDETFPSMGIRVLSIIENYDSANGDDSIQALMVGMRNIANQYEADNAQRKVRQVLRLKMERNEAVGRVPYGYRKAGRNIEPDSDTSAVVKQIFELAQKFSTEGSRGIAAKIINYLNERLILSPNGGIWGETTIKRILHNPVYYGKYVAHKEERNRKKRTAIPVDMQIMKDNHHPAIISLEQYEAVQTMLRRCETDGTDRQEEQKSSDKLIDDLKGIAKCSSCGRSLAYIRPNKKTGVKTAKYYCRNHTGAKATGERFEERPEITEAELKQKIIDACNACIDSIESDEPMMILTENDNSWHSALELKDWLSNLENRLQLTWDKNEFWYDKFCACEITKEEYIVHRDEWREIKEALETEIQTVKSMENRISEADKKRKSMKGKFPKMTVFDSEKVKTMVDCVLLNPDGTVKVLFEERIRMLAETRVNISGVSDNTK